VGDLPLAYAKRRTIRMTTAETTYGTANMKGKSQTALEDCP
jgi:hypothetical protein